MAMNYKERHKLVGVARDTPVMGTGRDADADLSLTYRDYSERVQNKTLAMLVIAAALYGAIALLSLIDRIGDGPVMLSLRMSFDSAATLLGFVVAVILSINVAAVLPNVDSDVRVLSQVATVDKVMGLSALVSAVIAISALGDSFAQRRIDLPVVMLTSIAVGLTALAVETGERLPPQLIDRLSRTVAETRRGELRVVEALWAPRLPLDGRLELCALAAGWGATIAYAALAPFMAALWVLIIVNPTSLWGLGWRVGALSLAMAVTVVYAAQILASAWASRRTSDRLGAAIVGACASLLVTMDLLTALLLARGDAALSAAFVLSQAITILVAVAAVVREVPVVQRPARPRFGGLRAVVGDLLPAAPVREHLSRSRRRELDRIEKRLQETPHGSKDVPLAPVRVRRLLIDGGMVRATPTDAEPIR
ncbi:hypothetical protein KV100_03080 [Mumia sp. zg.B21]|uniref:hypothetical protein n=1 Tax=Mumia sp. zg.B21 TaxID=2855447 RepID=UPI001C6DE9B6|nr:hypothetical protein [Mumia sp. zg.B21]MBW9208624.1 hypothetical protein [Mumia sp. zg.B21]